LEEKGLHVLEDNRQVDPCDVDGWSNLMHTVAYILYAALLIYSWLIIARAVLSWFRAPYGGPVYQIQRALYALTEPYLRLFRRIIPTARLGSVGLDLSSLVGLFVLYVVIRLLTRI
jgi:YggT family protein